MPVLLYLLAVAVFAQGTSEFILAGLLSGIADDLDVSISRAGLLISAFAVGMVLGAPSMAALGRRLSPRWTLTAFLAAFIVAHSLGAATDSFAVLFATRIIAALANAGFLAVTLSTVTAIVPAERRARALTVILGGTTLALIAGVPAGALLGSAFSWRAALWAIAIISLPALFAVLAATPTRLPGDRSRAGIGKLGEELDCLKQRPLQLNLLLAVLVNGATFCGFTYLAAIATGPAGLSEDVVPVLLAVFGVGAFLGVSTVGRFADQHWRRVIAVSGPLLLAGWTLMAVTVASPIAFWVLVLMQGALSFALGSTLIARIMATAHTAPTMGGSFATIALNLGAIVGPVAGGIVIERTESRGALFTSAGLVLIAVLVWWASTTLARRSARRPVIS